jgi:GT2 family glycosyltransferase
VNGAETDISLVVPTFNRVAALRENLADMLSLEGLCEVILVDDGSTDETLEFCRELDDRKLRVVSHGHNRGLPAARNTGAQQSRGAWVLFGEDDCRFPPDYAVILREVARREEADIVGAPLLRVFGADKAAAGEAAAKAAASAPRSRLPPTMDQDSVFPAVPISTPFLPARSLVRREVFRTVSFDESYVVNAYREETDFFVQASRAGFRCLLTAETYCYQRSSFSGGASQTSRLRYEYWTLRNNWTFLRRHGSWLIEQGYIRGPVTAQARFTVRRVVGTGQGVLRARLHRLRAALAHGGS